jgi:hypothetical protein
MTYNGIGIATPRGTGTSGYVQRALGSLSHERATWEERKAQQSRAAFGGDAAQMVRHVDPGVIEHERKRAVEVRLTDWADEQGLFDKPYDSTFFFFFFKSFTSSQLRPSYLSVWMKWNVNSS